MKSSQNSSIPPQIREQYEDRVLRDGPPLNFSSFTI
jgi:hypothetical protein